jgi:hypothetical protein
MLTKGRYLFTSISTGVSSGPIDYARDKASHEKTEQTTNSIILRLCLQYALACAGDRPRADNGWDPSICSELFADETAR